jgi:hypothetical protein
MSQTWKSREETYHGSKWGYVVVALVILIVLALLGSIFYLIGQSLKSFSGMEPATIVFYTGVGVGVGIIVLILLVKAGIIAAATVLYIYTGLKSLILMPIWTLFTNLYILVIVLIISAVLIFAIFTAVQGHVEISLQNPVVIAVLILLFFMFFPLAIFLVDQFSYEHE